MSTYSEIQNLLNTQLQEYSGAPTIVWENTKYIPAEDEIYFDVRLNPGEPEIRALGPKAPLYYSGTFLVNVCGIKGAGYGDIASHVDDVLDNFFTGLILIGETFNVKVVKSWPVAGFNSDTGRYVVPIKIRYYCYV